MKSTLLTPLFLLGLWRGEFVTGQTFNCSTFGEVRLNEANYFVDRAGRVEICSCDAVLGAGGCRWVTVPVASETGSWGWKNAQVVCRQIYPEDYGAMNPIIFSSIAPNSDQQDVYQETFACDGSEEHLLNCPTMPASASARSRDALIQCRNTVPGSSITFVRLSGASADDAEGIVEIYSAVEGWVTICGDFWDIAAANVTCVQLGYDSGVANILPAGSTTPSVRYTNFRCSGTEPTLYEGCSYDIGTSCLSPTARAGVVCSRSDLVDGSVRLFSGAPEGSTDYDQRVEVLYDGRWGSICDTGWDLDDGSVACNAVGGGSPEIEPVPSFYVNYQARPFWLTSLSCVGSEVNLTQCSVTYPVGYAPFCDHPTDDAALVCNTGASGLSGGEIAGIVIGSLAFLGIVGFIIHLNDKKKKQRALEQQRQHQTAAATAAAVVTTNTSRGETATSADATEPSSSNADNPSTLPRVESDTELRKGAPPSYNEAIRITQAFSDINTNLPNASTSDQSPEGSLPPYPVAGGIPSQPTSDSTSNLPYPSTSSSNTVPYPPADNIGLLPYPHADAASAPYPPPSDVQVPYPGAVPTAPAHSDIQNYPPPTNPGYPPPTHPSFIPPPSAPIGYPLQPFDVPGYPSNQPDVNVPLPPVLQSYEQQEANL